MTTYKIKFPDHQQKPTPKYMDPVFSLWVEQPRLPKYHSRKVKIPPLLDLPLLLFAVYTLLMN